MLKADASETRNVLKPALPEPGSALAVSALAEQTLAELALAEALAILALGQIRERMELLWSASRVPQPTGEPLLSPPLRLGKAEALRHEAWLWDARVTETLNSVHRETNLIERINGLVDAIVQHLEFANVDFGFHGFFLP